jgi:hypothetical protein
MAIASPSIAPRKLKQVGCTNGREAREGLQSLGIRPLIIIWAEARLTSTDIHQQPRHLRVEFEGNFIGALKNCFRSSTIRTAFNSLPGVNLR